MLDDEISSILEKLDVYLTTLRLKCKFFEKPYDSERSSVKCNSIEKERELIISA